MRRLPMESLVYLGDTARVPYGTKSPETVLRYARAACRVLATQNVKLIVIACNTASAASLSTLQDELEIPVLGVIEPGCRAALDATRSGRVGIIGTPSTIGSGHYQTTIQELAPETEVFCNACPLFVPLAEEGWVRGPVPAAAAKRYLVPLLKEGIDTLLLGCTHYPLLRDVIADTAGDPVTIVDSAESTAKVVEEILDGMNIRSSKSGEADLRFLVSDSPEQFARVGRDFLGATIREAEWVDF